MLSVHEPKGSPHNFHTSLRALLTLRGKYMELCLIKNEIECTASTKKKAHKNQTRRSSMVWERTISARAVFSLPVLSDIFLLKSSPFNSLLRFAYKHKVYFRAKKYIQSHSRLTQTHHSRLLHSYSSLCLCWGLWDGGPASSSPLTHITKTQNSKKANEHLRQWKESPYTQLGGNVDVGLWKFNEMRLRGSRKRASNSVVLHSECNGYFFLFHMKFFLFFFMLPYGSCRHTASGAQNREKSSRSQQPRLKFNNFSLVTSSKPSLRALVRGSAENDNDRRMNGWNYNRYL